MEQKYTKINPSRLRPGHEVRMAAHERRVQADLKALAGQPDWDKPRFDMRHRENRTEVPGVSLRTAISFRVRAFRMLWKQSKHMDPYIRFASALELSLRPVYDPDLLQQWHNTYCRQRGSGKVTA